jgi:putative thioredoxin
MAQELNIIEVQESSFETDVIQRSFDKAVVVDFWAAWCGPCRMLGPVLEKLASEPDSNFVLAKVDVDRNPGLSMRYGVQGIPAVKAFKNGQIAGEFVGAQPEPMVRKFIEDIAPSEANKSTSSAKQLLAERRWKDAEAIYRESLEKSPTDVYAKLGLAKALLGQGEGCKARFYLEDLTNNSETMDTATRLLPLAIHSCSTIEEGRQEAELTVVEAQYRQAARLFNEQKYAPSLDGFLDVLRKNKDYRDGQAKEVVLGIFELLGDEDPLTQLYRRELASILFQ